MKKIFINGKIYTGSLKKFAQAFVLENDRFIFVGDSISALKKFNASDVMIIDLKNKTVLPGFIDSHIHLDSGILSLDRLDLTEAENKKEFIKTIKGFVSGLKKGQWALGGGWDHRKLKGEMPDKKWVDAITSENPLFLFSADGHTALANSQALKIAGITKESPDTDSGKIVRYPGSLEPNGILKDKAIEMVISKIGHAGCNEQKKSLDKVQDYALSLGITGLNDMGIYRGRSESLFRTAFDLFKKNKLRIRMGFYFPLDDIDVFDDLKKKHCGENNFVYLLGLKGFVDGSLGSGTALFKEKYKDNSEGLLLNDINALRKNIMNADKKKYQLAVHAIGDLANSLLLDIIQDVTDRNPFFDRRFRIEHAQHILPSDIKRFKKLNVIASVQPSHIYFDGSWADDVIPEKTGSVPFPLKSFIKNKVDLAFGTDWTVAPLDPFLNIYSAVTRRTKENIHKDGWMPFERITLKQAIDSYTAGSAYAEFNDEKKGRIKPGYLADFIVLDRDIFSVASELIPDVRVAETYIGADKVFEL